MRAIACLLGLTLPCYAKPKNDRADIAFAVYQKGTTPYEYIADKLRNYKVVAIGEDHWIADHSEFLCDVLRNVGYTEDTHISNLALEFGSERDQMMADTLAFGKIWNEEYANKILPWRPPIYWAIHIKDTGTSYTLSGETNQQKPDSLKTRIVLLDPWDFTRNPKIRDENMAKNLRNLICSKGKTIFYAGQAHTQYQTRGQQGRNNGYYYNYPSGAKNT